MEKAQIKKQTQNPLEQAIPLESFPGLDSIFKEFSKDEFKSRSARKRFHFVNEQLLKLIQEAPEEAFLFSAIIEFIERINSEKIFHEKYHISLFEFWLNLFSELPDLENYKVRAKITGKYIPREDYQAFFPIGMDKTFSGTHFVSAHLSPDVDTMIASFWGWLDAFSARVGSAQHLWSLPGGPPESPVTQILRQLFGTSIFSNTAHMSFALTLKALDLVTQKGFVKKKGDATISALDLSSHDKGVVLVDEEGNFLGDWQSSDVEPVRKIIIRFKSCLRWFENNLHVQLISLFAKEKLHVSDIPPFLSKVFDGAISECEPVKEFIERQRKDLNDFLCKVIGVKKGIEGTFGELIQALANLSVYDLSHFQAELESLKSSKLFDSSGYLREDRPAIFNLFEKIIHQLDNAIHRIRDYAEQLDVSMNIKSKVLGISSQYTTPRNDVEDMRIKIKKWDFLTVVVPEDNNKLFPIGVVWAHDLNKSILGTVSFRDFCNQEEVKMASYLTPISVVDHHKASLKTSSAPNAIIGDAQSCNVLIAEQAFNINAKYSLGGMTAEAIESQINQLREEKATPSNMRLMQRLMQRKIASMSRNEHYIHPTRELTEYMCFLYAILDDTDLLTKVSKRDIECIVELLNRIKSLTSKEEVEIINLDDIPRDQKYCNAAAKKILKNPEMYGIYQMLFETRERDIEINLDLKTSEHFSNLFIDTKEQNGCCRIGQTKLFTINFPSFIKKSTQLMEYWLANAQTVNQAHPEIDFHLHMISTVPSAGEVYEDRVGHYKHQDELWFWIPSTLKGFDHLSSFLNAFIPGQKMGSSATIEFMQGVPDEVIHIFSRDLNSIPQKISVTGPNLPIVVLHFPAGTINSRKAMITPYLPRLAP